MKNLFARIAAVAGLTLLFGATSYAQMAPPAAPAAPMAAPATTVKSHLRKLKSGKTIAVKGYTRTKTTMPKMTAVKGYTRTTKSGKTVTVKGYSRKAPAMKTMKKM